ncbi:MAG: OsmC family protein, partial [Deltaproteobacteria bacterium]|nr:OsmC family protein [Deltaproteobacteria bacterium]
MSKKVFGVVGEGKRIDYGFDLEHRSYCDVDRLYGGLEEYPAPRDIFSASVGLCVVAVLSIYIESKLKSSAQGLRFESNYQKGDDGRVIEIELKICIPKHFEDKKEELIKIAESCPIKKTVSPFIDVKTFYYFE